MIPGLVASEALCGLLSPQHLLILTIQEVSYVIPGLVESKSLRGLLSSHVRRQGR